MSPGKAGTEKQGLKTQSSRHSALPQEGQGCYWALQLTVGPHLLGF